MLHMAAGNTLLISIVFSVKLWVRISSPYSDPTDPEIYVTAMRISPRHVKIWDMIPNMILRGE